MSPSDQTMFIGVAATGYPTELPANDNGIDEVDPIDTDLPLQQGQRRHGEPVRRWWLASVLVGVLLTAGFVLVTLRGPGTGWFDRDSTGWWLVTTILHAPYVVILLFLTGGVIERVGYLRAGRAPAPAGRLPTVYPTVCVQLPMFNEHAVARRAIEAACSMQWPADRLSVQVLDDSTDADTRALVADVCATLRVSTGVNCHVRHRSDRHGYKAGALEEGRCATDAEFLAIFDSDFLPPKDFLLRTVPHFYSGDGRVDEGLALVQTQWGHLNHDESSLTQAQSLWVDDHHTLQMSWRSAKWEFVNFTGTAGVWRAAAIDDVGGWRAASLVEDCELSFRHLFGGYRTKFVKEIVVPAELPATYTAYKAQQRRWTRGWVQLQRMHLGALLFRHRCRPLRKLHLAYHMCISWQWPAWAIWTMTLPLMIYSGHWFGSVGTVAGVGLYLLPTMLFAVFAATLASVETKHTYPERLGRAVVRRRLRRMVPYLVINTGMIPHQFSSFAEGLFGGMHGEFERTPKVASVTDASAASTTGPAASRRYGVKIHWSYVLAEAFYVTYQLTCATVLAMSGLVWSAVGAAALAATVLYVAFFYGDHAGKVLFVVDRHRLSGPGLRTLKTRARSLVAPVPFTPVAREPGVVIE